MSDAISTMGWDKKNTKETSRFWCIPKPGRLRMSVIKFDPLPKEYNVRYLERSS